VAERIALVHSSEPAERAAEILANSLATMAAQIGSPSLAIPGGSALAAVGLARQRLGAIWRTIRLTWTDERCVPFVDGASNRGTAYRSGALSAGDPPGDLLPLFLDGERGEDATKRVEGALAARFGGKLDAVLLGLGADGHVASLFPGAALHERALVAFVRASPKPPAQRITLTRSMLATARHAVLVVSGEAKRPALLRLLAGDVLLPATALARVSIVTDIELATEESA